MKAPLGQAQRGITIVNRRNGRVAGVYVGRPSVLGNLYVIGHDGSRHDVVDKYRAWLREQYRHDGAVRRALRQLAMRYLTDGALTLICWCAPQPCHAEVIRDAVLGMVQARERAREARADRRQS
jgi:hypothetical protein